jgi:hypothetical protein
MLPYQMPNVRHDHSSKDFFILKFDFSLFVSGRVRLINQGVMKIALVRTVVLGWYRNCYVKVVVKWGFNIENGLFP